MRDVAGIPRRDFETIREAEQAVYDRLREANPDTLIARPLTDMWSTDHTERAGDSWLELDTTAYSAIHIPKGHGFTRAGVHVFRLAMFELMQNDSVGVARVYQMNLIRGREHLVRYPVWQKLGEDALGLRNKNVIKVPQKALANFGGATGKSGLAAAAAFKKKYETPTPEDIETVIAQLRRGRMGLYTRSQADLA